MAEDEARGFYETKLGHRFRDDTWELAKIMIDPVSAYEDEKVDDRDFYLEKLTELRDYEINGLSKTPPPLGSYSQALPLAEYSKNDQGILLALTNYCYEEARILRATKMFRNNVFGTGRAGYCFGPDYPTSQRPPFRHSSDIPSHKLFNKNQAIDFMLSPAINHLSYDQFREWGISVSKHQATIKSKSLPNEDIQEVDIYIDPPGHTFRIRANKPSVTIDGCILPQDGNVPIYPLNYKEISYGSGDIVAMNNQSDDIILPTFRTNPVTANKTISYPNKTKGIVNIEIWPNSVMDELRSVSEFLAATYHWDNIDAIRFLLTDYKPWIEAIHSTTVRGASGDTLDASLKIRILPWIDHQTLDAVYRDIKKDIRPGTRHLDQKSLDIFNYVTKEVGANIGPKDYRWKELTTGWDRNHPRSDGLPVFRFRQCYYRAKKSLLGHRKWLHP